MSLAPAEQSIQLLTCHISRWKLCHRSPQDNQSKSWKKSVTSVFLSLITSHAISTSRAEHTTSYRGRATTSFISYHQLKTWSLILKTISLNLGRRCGQTEIVCHWSLLISLELAEQSIKLLKCHRSRWRLCDRSPQDNYGNPNLRKRGDLWFFVTGDGVYDTWEQFIAGVHKAGNIY